MTSDIEERTEEKLARVDAGDESADTSVTSAVASRFLEVSFAFFAVGMIDMLILAIKRVEPDFLGGVALFSYGRLVPAATTLLLYGWLTIGMLGALIFVVSKVTEKNIADAALVQGALALLSLVYFGGAVAVVLGLSEGRRYLESPLVFDLVALVGILIVARSLIKTAKGGPSSSPVVWYSVASVVWLVLAHIAGNWPGLGGYTGQLQTSFYRSAFIGLWLASAALAVIYYSVPRLAGRPAIVGNRLTLLGIWSLGLTWAMTGPADITFGAAGDWLETIGVIFSIVLFLPILVIATDLVHSMRGAWGNVRDRTALRFLMAGLGMFGVYAVFNLVQALRASSAVVGFTDWVAATETLTLFGPFAFVLVGLLRVGALDLFGSHPQRGIAGYRLALVGLLITVGAMAIAGLQTGFTWAGAANNAAFENTGDGWLSTLGPLSGNYIVQLVGLGIIAAAIAVSILRTMGRGAESLRADPIEAAFAEPDLVLEEPPSVGKVRRYAYGFFALAALMVFILPALEREDPTILAEDSRTFEGNAAVGRDIYVQEGCTYCHTQQVRPIVTDVGLGPVSVLGDFANETPVLIGVQRYGPDLMHFADRADVENLASHLQKPRDAEILDRPWSIMPSYSYLSSDDLAALTAYLIGEE